MPRRSYPRRPRRPRFGRRFRRYRRKKVTNMWPRGKLVKFSMVFRSAPAGNGGAIGVSVIKANSLNDPSGSITAQLPIGLDQWAGMYSKYKVVNSRINIIAHPTTITGAAVFGIHLADSATTLTDVDHYRELPATTSRIVSPDIDVAKCGLGFSPRKFFSIRNIKDADELEGTFSTTPGDPTKLAYWHVFFQDHNNTDNVVMEATYRVDYTVLLYGRIDPARSAL